MIIDQILKDNADKFEALYKLYEEYNSHTNISAIREKADVFEKHFKDSLSILEHCDLNEGSKVLDIGAGGGFPIIPLAIALPNVNFVALDASTKKTKFIESVKESLSLGNLEIITGRAEELAHEDFHREAYDFVLARAVAKLSILLELVVGFVKMEGSFIAYKAHPIKDEESESMNSQKQLSLKFKKRKVLSGDKQLIFFIKNDKLGKKYPRQYAQIKSKPL